MSSPHSKGTLDYLNAGHTLSSWLFTKDHKRIGIMYLVAVMFFFFLGSLAAAFVRVELTSYDGLILQSETFNKMFSAHGIIMIFLFLLLAIPATLGNFLLPIMIGARDMAFPRLNLLSFYLYIIGASFIMLAMLLGGVDVGWTYYTPYSSIYSNSQIALSLIGIFIAGFSSIATAINFIVTVHKMRAPGLTWFRLPHFVWANYATALIVILGTPVVAITLLLIVLERVLRVGIFSPELGGDPVLFQHLFWFYSHPAVYIMVLPAMGVITEIISCFSKKRVFGYDFVVFSTLAIAGLGFLVWGHHMFISSQSVYKGLIFSLLSFMVAIPSAVKVFNWTFTMWKGSISFNTPMLYAMGFMGLFVVGGLTGLYLASIDTNVHLTGTYFVVAHFHYVMVGGTIMAFLGGLHFWWPKMFGVMYPEFWAKLSALGTFVGFNLTFFPQFILGYLGMPRRYHYYYFAPEWQIYHVMSTLGSAVLGIAFFIPLVYLIASLRKRTEQARNPWGAKGLEWQTASPPPVHNFTARFVIEEAYDYDAIADSEGREQELNPIGGTRIGQREDVKR